MRTLQEKRRIVEEVLRGGESVAVIARRHAVNANLVFSWKRQYEKGLLEPSGTALVPVRVSKQSLRPARSSRSADDECVEIDLGAGKCMRLRGELALALLDRALLALCGR
jgi:transposase